MKRLKNGPKVKAKANNSILSDEIKENYSNYLTGYRVRVGGIWYDLRNITLDQAEIIASHTNLFKVKK